MMHTAVVTLSYTTKCDVSLYWTLFVCMYVFTKPCNVDCSSWPQAYKLYKSVWDKCQVFDEEGYELLLLRNDIVTYANWCS